MRTYLLLLSISMAVGCASTAEKNTAKKSENRCEKLGVVVASATVMKWISRQPSSGNTAADIAFLDWRFLAAANHDDFTKLGLSQKEIESVSKEIFNTDVMDDMQYDTFSFKYYTQRKCEMLEKGLSVESIITLKPSIQKCWNQYQAVDSEQCISKVVAREIEL